MDKLTCGVSTVGDVVTTINSLVETAQGAKSTSEYIPIDAHYGALLGIGARGSEPLQELVFDLSAPVLSGATTLTLTNSTSGLVVGQLIAVKTDGDNYYAHRVVSVTGGVLEITPKLKRSVTTTNAVVGTFYKDAHHPTVYGYRALVTYSLENLKTKSLVSKFWLNKNSASSTISTDTTNTMLNMGSSTVPAKTITTTNVATQGAFYQKRLPEVGDFVFDVETYSTSAVTVSVTIDGATAFQTVIPENYSGKTTCNFTLREPGQLVLIRVVGNNNPATVNVAEVIRIYKETSVSRIDHGKHCLLGDSWFAQVGFSEFLAVKLPNAQITNKGVGGRKATDILINFTPDVTEKYDYIWCICGTNDYVAGVTQDNYSSAVSRIKGMAVATGATFIYLGSSVAPADSETTQFNLSRQYAKLTDLSDSLNRTELTVVLPTTIVAGGSAAVLANLGYFDPEITITGYYIFGAGLSVRHKSTITAGSGTQVLALNDSALNSTKTTYTVGASRLIDVYANNVSGAPITYGGYITYINNK